MTTSATTGSLRDWLAKQVKRIRREDSEVGCPDVFLKREGYVSRARWNLWFGMSCFLYTLCGFYMILTHEVLDRKYPSTSGLWFWEGMFLVLQGPISYWNDVHNFGLDRLASSVDRTTAVCCFVFQIVKALALPMPYPKNWLFFVVLWVAGAVFLRASTLFGDLLSAAGGADFKSRDQGGAGAGGERDVMATAGTTGKGDGAKDDPGSSVVSTAPRRTGAATTKKKGENSQSPARADGAAPSSRSSRNKTPTPKRSLQGMRRAPAPPQSCSNKQYRTVKLRDELKQAHAEVETKFAAYLLWHSLWHVALPVPAILLMASARWEEDLAVLPGRLGELDLRQLVHPENYYL
eukprot:g3453.t1